MGVYHRYFPHAGFVTNGLSHDTKCRKSFTGMVFTGWSLLFRQKDFQLKPVVFYTHGHISLIFFHGIADALQTETVIFPVTLSCLWNISSATSNSCSQ